MQGFVLTGDDLAAFLQFTGLDSSQAASQSYGPLGVPYVWSGRLINVTGPPFTATDITNTPQGNAIPVAPNVHLNPPAAPDGLFGYSWLEIGIGGVLLYYLWQKL